MQIPALKTTLMKRIVVLFFSLLLFVHSFAPLASARVLINNDPGSSQSNDPAPAASARVFFDNDPGLPRLTGTHAGSATPVPASATPTILSATASAALISLVTAAQNPFAELPPPNTSQTPPALSLLQLAPSSLSGGQPSQLAIPTLPRPAARVIPLPKKIFKANEPIAITVANAKPEELQISATDPLGKQVDPDFIEKLPLDTQTIISLKPSRIGIRPGSYTMHITDATGKTTTQQFTWGVLAMNTNKSMYTPEQTAMIAMSVLDEQGNMVCDARVTLAITDPSGTKTTLSTAQNTTTLSDQPSAANAASPRASASATPTPLTSSAASSAALGGENHITVNPQCLSHNFSLTPDYAATYQVHKTGQYSLTLSATTKQGTNTITDTFSSAETVPFDVERISATRLYPPNQYPMLFHITAHQDFSGTIMETAPPNFDVSPSAPSSSQPYATSHLLMPLTDMQTQFGTPALSLTHPFSGDYSFTQGFGEELTDPEERAFYHSFGLAGHDGLDFALPMKTPVLATDDGVVSLAGDGAYGITVVIDHAWGRSYYGHLNTTAVTVGQTVTKGHAIGLSGNTGHSTGPHLHFGIKPRNPNTQNGFYGKVDPAPYLGLGTQTAASPAVWTTSSVKSANKVVTWNVSLKSGESIDLGYSYQAPGLSPQLYAFGPLTFANKNQTVFQEARLWQVAVDGNSTAGPNNCGTAVDDGSNGSGNPWGTPGNACTSGQTATASVSTFISSDWLKISNFGFTSGTIPTGSKILGIQFAVSKSQIKVDGTTTDLAVRDVKGGTIDTANDHSTSTDWPSTAATTTYGSTSDLWGQSWTAADITASNFGIAISVKNNGFSGASAAVNGIVTATITYNKPPNAPSKDQPADNTINMSTTPVFKMTATDPETDNLKYKVTIYSNSACTAVTQTNDESSSQTGWSGQNATCTSGTDCYTSGTQATFTTQTALSLSTQYWWKANAIDPLGSNTSTDSTTCNSFTTGPSLDALMRHGKWFSSEGLRQPFTF